MLIRETVAEICPAPAFNNDRSTYASLPLVQIRRTIEQPLRRRIGARDSSSNLAPSHHGGAPDVADAGGDGDHELAILQTPLAQSLVDGNHEVHLA